MLPVNPVGLVELTEEDLDHVVGGAAAYDSNHCTCGCFRAVAR
jgi:hypothetical protein